MKVLYSPESLRTLDGIWQWNAEQYGPDYADRYLAFLRTQIQRLTSSPPGGRPVPTRPDLRYLLLRRRRRGHGHIAVYRFAEEAIQILDFFHTAQDWQSRVAE